LQCIHPVKADELAAIVALQSLWKRTLILSNASKFITNIDAFQRLADTITEAFFTAIIHYS